MTSGRDVPPLSSVPPIRPGERVLVAILLAIFALLALHSMARKNPTVEETPGLAAGLAAVQAGDFRMDADRPPLPKLLAGAAAWMSGARVNTGSEAWAAGDIREVARETLYGGDVPWRRILFFGRVPAVALGVALGLLVWRWTRTLAGPESAGVALAFYSFCPNLLAYTRLITAEVPLALGVLATAWCLWHAWRTGSARAIAGAAALVALSTVTDFAVLAWVPIWAVLAWLPSGQRPRARGLAHLGLFAVLTLVLTELAVSLAYGFAHDWTTVREIGLAGRGVAPETIPAARRLPFAILAGVPWPSPEFALGLRDYLLGPDGGHPVYLLGRVSVEGWWWAPFVTIFVKMPLPLILLTAVAKLELIRRPKAWRRDLWFLVLPAILPFAAVVVANRGPDVRYLLPMFPFVMMVAAWPLRFGFPARRPARLGLVLLVGWQVGGALWFHPDYLPYFNEIARAAGGGARFLGDSNVDWGQDLSAAAERLKERGARRAILGYHGTADPFVEGVEWQILPPAPRPKGAAPWTVLPPEGEEWLVLGMTIRQGIYARAPGSGLPYPWLEGVKPTEVVGHGTMSLYEISRNADVQRALADLYLRHGLAEEAEAALIRAIVRVEFDGESRKKLVAIYRSRGELARADSTILAGPNPDAELLLEWTSIRRQLGDDERTKDAFEQSLRGFSNDPGLKNAYADWLQETGRDLDRALALASEAVDWMGEVSAYRDTRGMVHRKLGEPLAALEDFDAALALPNGDRPEIRWHRVLALEEAGRPDEALAEAQALATREDLDDATREEVERWLWDAAR